MNSHAWNLWLSTLPVRRRQEYEQVLDRITTLLAHDRIVILDDIARVERRMDTQRQLITETQQGVDALLDARAVGEAARPVAVSS